MEAQGYGSVCCAFLWEGREVYRFGGYKERNNPEGGEEAAGQRVRLTEQSPRAAGGWEEGNWAV